MSAAPVLPDGWRLVALDSVGSTNDEAARLSDGIPSERPRERLWQRSVV